MIALGDADGDTQFEQSKHASQEAVLVVQPVDLHHIYITISDYNKIRTFFSKTTGHSIRMENKGERSRCNTSTDAQSSCGRSDGQPAKKRGMCPHV